MYIENKNNNVGPPEPKSGADPARQSCSPALTDTDPIIHASTDSAAAVGRTVPVSRPSHGVPASAGPDSSVSSARSVLKSSTNPTIPAPRRQRAKFKHRHHRRTGKVARLPNAVRHEIALRFMRYEEYQDIIAWLASHGHPGISESNLSRWRKGGFQDWLRKEQQKRMDLIHFTLEVLEELVAAEKKNLPFNPSTNQPPKPNENEQPKNN